MIVKGMLFIRTWISLTFRFSQTQVGLKFLPAGKTPDAPAFPARVERAGGEVIRNPDVDFDGFAHAANVTLPSLHGKIVFNLFGSLSRTEKSEESMSREWEIELIPLTIIPLTFPFRCGPRKLPPFPSRMDW
jgi:hypothetical protein